jgi:4-hydroxy-3-polyprenylbenzoate decarboxylase
MNKIVVAVTGASGSLYARILLDKLLQARSQWQEVSVVMTNNSKDVWQIEIGSNSYVNYPFTFYDKNNFNAPFASGSARYNTMIIVPCSMGTLARVAAGISNDLITRAADVMLKERRKLICIVRETPYNLVHIRNMETITLSGGIICPASPSFYNKPVSLEDAVATVVDRVLDLAGIEVKTNRWGNEKGK